MALLGLLFVLVPLVELAVIIKVGSAIGVWPTLALLLGVSILGAWLVKHQGLATYRRIQAEVASHRMPGASVVDGGLILLAGALLLTPGFVTDAVGLLLLLPPVRAGVRGFLRRRYLPNAVLRGTRLVSFTGSGRGSGRGSGGPGPGGAAGPDRPGGGPAGSAPGPPGPPRDPPRELGPGG